MSHHPTSMHQDRRRGQYIAQNNGGVMTPRQRRRWKHKLNRALLAAAKTAGAR